MIVDAHAHLHTPILGVTPEPERRRMTRLLMWGYEVMRFHNPFRNPLWKGEPPEPARMLIAMENQVRLSMGCKENLLRYMNRNGIDKSVVLPIAPFSTSEEYLRECAGEPRLIPFASVHPSGNWEKDLHKAMEGGCRGLKIHPILQRIAPEDPFYFHLMEAFAPYGKPVLAHTGEFDYYVVRDGYASYGDVRRLEKLIASFPQVPFILGHMGLYHPERAIELARRYPNVYLEISFQPLPVVKKALRAAGKDRVMFGSDWPESDSRYALRIARRAAGGDRELEEKLTGGNILALLA